MGKEGVKACCERQWDTTGVFRHIHPNCRELQVCAPKAARRDPGEVRQPVRARQDLG